MSNNVLVVMAAGLGSRYGGVKQLEPVGPAGEIIMDYSVYDAIEAGFKKVIFIIRRDLEKDFREVIGDRVSKYIEAEYVFQELDDLPAGHVKPDGRTKPWGTGQAVLCCIDKIKTPFVVVNADDYYGKEAFRMMNEFLDRPRPMDGNFHFCMAGFELKNTLSEHGTVTRGVCSVDEQSRLIRVEETYQIRRDGDEAVSGTGRRIALDSPVSMNMFGYTPDFLEELKVRFSDFLDGIPSGNLEAEFLLPDIMGKMIREGKTDISVLRSGDKWFGVTYKEDREYVIEAFQNFKQKGVYPEKLFI